MKLYGIIESVPYGEFVHIVSAKSQKEAKKIVKLESDGTISEIKLLKPSKESSVIFTGGTRE
jgi:hypothetical protein